MKLEEIYQYFPINHEFKRCAQSFENLNGDDQYENFEIRDEIANNKKSNFNEVEKGKIY